MRVAVRWSVVAGTTVALVVLPGAVATWTSASGLTMAGLPDAVAAGFGHWVASGRSGTDPQLAAASSFWRVFHVVKAVLAALLLAVVAVVGRRRWQAHLTAATPRRRRLAGWGGVASAATAAVLVLVVVANLQGAVAPLSSVLTFLPLHGSEAVGSVRAVLVSGRSTPVSVTLVDDFRLYHAALVATLVPVLLAGAVVTVLVWARRRAAPASDGRRRRLLATVGTAVPGFGLLLAVVLAANVSTVLDTAPALSAFFDGSGG